MTHMTHEEEEKCDLRTREQLIETDQKLAQILLSDRNLKITMINVLQNPVVELDSIYK